MKYIVLLIVALVGTHSWADSFCVTTEPNKTYVKVQTDLEAKIVKFANRPAVASQADALMSKLISAKSAVLIDWMNKRNLKSEAEDTIIRAWREYYARNFVLGKYPTGDAKVDVEVETLVDGILKDSIDKAFKSRMETLFQKAKTGAIATIVSFDVPAKEDIKKRIAAMKLYWPSNLKAARNNSVPLEIIDWGIAYDPVANEINMGLKALAYSSDETYVAVFAHEIGHSFDSCRWGAFFTGEWPFKKVGECLRTKESVFALSRDDSKLEAAVKDGKISQDLAQGLKQNPTCNRLVYPPPGVQADQLPESFADWFSAEVLARLEGFDVIKARQDLCAKKDLMTGSSYPPNDDRLGRIYFANPTLKAKRGDAETLTAKYCPLK